MINYYHRFLPVIAITFGPVYASLKGKPKDLKWSPLQEAAFYNAKKALSTAAALTFPVQPAPLLFSTDASDVAIGGLLMRLEATEGVSYSVEYPINFLQQHSSSTCVTSVYLSREGFRKIGSLHNKYFKCSNSA
ncbi:uncharacterized protein [Palaemon carinicauda]|uniref:uncharacterized protein n=1 Tax=Palaemon carinicauda TaxID=392227 RepID=UPI0035B5D3BB